MSAGAPAGAPAATTAVAGAPVRVWRDESVGRAASQLNARAFTHGGDVFLPAAHGSLDSGPAQALLAHELVHVQQQRQLGASLPAEHSPGGQRLELQARRAEQNAAAAPLPLAMPRPSPSVQAEPSPTSTVQASSETHLSSTPLTSSVQRAVEIGEVTSTAEPAAPGAMAIPTDPRQLDELAAKLWDRLRGRLRRELLADRERAGMLTDIR